MKKSLASALFAAMLIFSAQANAVTGVREIQVLARAVGFINGLPRGVVDVAVVDGPGAQQVFAEMRGASAGGVTLNPRIVPLRDLAQSGARIIVVPEGQSALHEQIATAARSLRAATLSTDMGCVRSNHCVVGVAASPRVEIVVSREAASASRVSFAQAFRVMIREI